MNVDYSKDGCWRVELSDADRLVARREADIKRRIKQACGTHIPQSCLDKKIDADLVGALADVSIRGALDVPWEHNGRRCEAIKVAELPLSWLIGQSVRRFEVGVVNSDEAVCEADI